MIEQDFIQIIKKYKLGYFIGEACRCLLNEHTDVIELQKAIQLINCRITQLNEENNKQHTKKPNNKKELLLETLSNTDKLKNI